MRTLTGLLAAALAPACTSVTIISPDDDVRVTRRFLAMGVLFDDPHASHVVRLRGVGYFAEPQGVAIGAHASDVAVLGDDCRAVIWVDSPAAAETVRAVVEDVAGACVAPVSAEQ